MFVPLPVFLSFLVGALCQSPFYPQPQAKVLFQDGSLVLCDSGSPCPAGYACVYAHFAPGLKACYSGIRDPLPRQGRCPLPSEAAQPATTFPGFFGPMSFLGPPQGSAALTPQRQPPPFGASLFPATAALPGSRCGSECFVDGDCTASTQKCCIVGGCGRSCVNSVAIDPAPKVTVLLEGLDQPLQAQSGMIMAGTVALVQSQGKNYLWDTGAALQKIPLLKALREKAGLEPADISQVLVSHGHPGHLSNWNLFPDTEKNFYKYNVKGASYVVNPLGQNPPQRYFLNNDSNIELIVTPGYYTNHDTSLFVYNVSQLGTVALVGDVVLNSNDWAVYNLSSPDPNLHRETRRRIFCTANFIVPGHEGMFQVTEAHRSKAGGCQGIQNVAQSSTMASTPTPTPKTAKPEPGKVEEPRPISNDEST